MGTDGGEVLLYSVEWNTDTQPATAIPRFEISKSVGKKQIDSLMITGMSNTTTKYNYFWDELNGSAQKDIN